MNGLIRSHTSVSGLSIRRRRVRDLIDFIEDREIDVVIDVGANVGQFGESLRDGGYRGRIVSFEPIKIRVSDLATRRTEGKWEVHHWRFGCCRWHGQSACVRTSVFSSILNITSAGLARQSNGCRPRRRGSDRTSDRKLRLKLSGQNTLKIDTRHERQVSKADSRQFAIVGNLLECPSFTVMREWSFLER